MQVFDDMGHAIDAAIESFFDLQYRIFGSFMPYVPIAFVGCCCGIALILSTVFHVR